jgi:hypothetical protein
MKQRLNEWQVSGFVVAVFRALFEMFHLKEECGVLNDTVTVQRILKAGETVRTPGPCLWNEGGRKLVFI